MTDANIDKAFIEAYEHAMEDASLGDITAIEYYFKELYDIMKGT